MRRLGAGVLVSLGCLATVEAARPAPPRAAVDAVRQRFPDRFLDPASWALGDLDGDGVPDLAAVLGDPMSNDADRILQLAVFRGKPGGGFGFAGVTQDLPSDGNLVQTVSIRGQALLLERDGADGYRHRWHETFRFRWRDGRPRLVGLDVARVVDDGPRDDHGQSVNLLTGDVVAWQAKGPRRTETHRVRRPVLVDFDRFDYLRVMQALGM